VSSGAWARAPLRGLEAAFGSRSPVARSECVPRDRQAGLFARWQHRARAAPRPDGGRIWP